MFGSNPRRAESAEPFMTYKSNGHQQNWAKANDLQIVFTLDLSGNLKSINPVGEEILGYRCQELRRTNLGQLVAAEFAEYVRQQIAQAKIGDLGAVYEIEVIARDRRKVRLEVSTRLVMRNQCPFELEGIALVRDQIPARRPRCLDEHFTLTYGFRPCPTLTFSSSGNKP